MATFKPRCTKSSLLTPILPNAEYIIKPLLLIEKHGLMKEHDLFYSDEFSL